MSDTNLCRFLHIDKRSDFNNKIVEYEPRKYGSYSLDNDYMNMIYSPNNADAIYKHLNNIKNLSNNYYTTIMTTYNDDNIEPAVKYNDIVFIKDTNEIWSHGIFYTSQNKTPKLTNTHALIYEPSSDNYILILFENPTMIWNSGLMDITLKISYYGFELISGNIQYSVYLNITVGSSISSAVRLISDASFHSCNNVFEKKTAILNNRILKAGCIFKPGSLMADILNPDGRQVVLVEGIGVTGISLVSEQDVIKYAQYYGSIELSTE